MTKVEDFDATVRQNLRTAFAAVHAGAGALRKGGGSIVLVSTAAAHRALQPRGHRGARRGCRAHPLGRGDLRPVGVRVNCVAPGLVDTELAAPIVGSEQASRPRGRYALQRIGQPDEVASAIEWLLDPAQSGVTGQVLGVDGGLGTVRPR